MGQGESRVAGLEAEVAALRARVEQLDGALRERDARDALDPGSGLTRDQRDRGLVVDLRSVQESASLNEARLEAFVRLNRMVGAPLPEIASFAMEEAVRLTQSTVGYIAFANEDETVLTMHAWSRSAMAECEVADKPIDYPVATTGLWGEAVRQRRPIITNDYAAPSEWKRGLPEGHVNVRRHMNVPVFDGDRIVIVAGVGNKATDYDESDVRQLTLLMTEMWRIVRRHQAEEEARSRTAELDRFFSVTLDLLCIADTNGRFLRVNPEWERTLGYKVEDLEGRRFLDLVHPDDIQATLEAMRELAAQRVVLGFVNRYRCKDGSYRFIEWRSMPVGELIYAAARDITGHREVEHRLAESEERYRLLAETAEDIIIVHDLEGRILYANPAGLAVTGFLAEDLPGQRLVDVLTPDAREAHLARMARRRAGDRSVMHSEVRLLTKAGQVLDVDVASSYLDTPGQPPRVLVIARNVSARKRAEEALRQSRQMLQSVLDHFPGVVFWKDLASVYLGCNRAFAQGAGLSEAEEIVGKTDFDLPWATTEAEKYRADDRDVMEGNRPKLGIVETQHQAGRRLTWFNTSKVPLTRPDGTVFGVLGVAADITEVRRLEEQYRQAQKMEAVGKLAGGIAHDFNNLLQIITGYLELAQLKLATAQIPAHELEEVGRATTRASTLVRQLLAFSRRQTMQCEHVDVDALIAGLAKMLRRLIEERIELQTVSHGPLPRVFADPGHLEQVVMNLCVNARDAMPGGGVLRIETRRVDLDAVTAARVPEAAPGPYVLLAVADTGCGIPQDDLDRIFEPFFTTKEVGKGTGLGLSMVYGIVKQHGGFVEVQSEVGRGTELRVFLPVAQPAEAGASDEEATLPLAPGGSETILLAEDDAQVREFAARVLREAGYRVLVARDGEEAVELAASAGETVDLYVLDAVMPRLSGKAVRDAIVARRPGAKILFCTGYSFDVLSDGGPLAVGLQALQKPFSRHALLRQVRGLLD